MTAKTQDLQEEAPVENPSNLLDKNSSGQHQQEHPRRAGKERPPNDRSSNKAHQIYQSTARSYTIFRINFKS